MSTDPAWAVPWLSDLVPIPPGYSWPRFMTLPHPDAVDSYGPRVVAWIEKRSRRALWWHQQLVVYRAFEHDAAGDLCWREVATAIMRQFGKSSLGGEVCAWRLEQGELFGQPQYVLHVAKDLAISMDVQRPHRVRAREDTSTYKVRESSGRVEIEYLPDDSRYALRSPEGVYGQSVSMAFVDEAWGVAPDAVDIGLVPTLMQKRNPQLWLMSTANDRATGLMLGRRAAGLAQLEEPAGLLWIEWSASPDADVADPQVWREACPMWTPSIERDMSAALSSALASRSPDPTVVDPVDGFAVQRLNRWRDHVEPVAQRGDPLVDLEAWNAVEHDEFPCGAIVVAIEENYGQGVAVAIAAELADGRRTYLEVGLHEQRGPAFDAAGWLVEHYSPARVFVGASLVNDPGARELNAKPAGTRETATGLPLLRELLATGRLVHFKSQALTDQLATARVTGTATGAMSLVGGHRSDAIRAAVWALSNLVLSPSARPMIY